MPVAEPTVVPAAEPSISAVPEAQRSAASYVSIPTVTQPSKEYLTGGVYPDGYDKQSKNEEEEDPQNCSI